MSAGLKRAGLWLAIAMFCLIVGFDAGRHPAFASKIMDVIRPPRSIAPAWDDPTAAPWPSDFSDVAINRQHALARPANGDHARPLVISLHTWSGDYRQSDPLAAFAKAQNWNYIHPDFEGMNDKPNACLSEKVIDDLDGTIAYAEANWHVDPSHIVVIGVSGGGYATLGAYLRLHHPVKAFIAWAPISDLESWYWETRNAGSGYDKKIVACTSKGNTPDFNAMKARSPINWPKPRAPANLEIYAGINDGYTGSVPITQSILFFNKLAGLNGVSPAEAAQLQSRDVRMAQGNIGGRPVYFSRQAGNARLTIFEGSHEMLSDYASARLGAYLN